MIPIVRKQASFNDYWGNGWPDISTIECCLGDPDKRAQFFAEGHDGGCFSVEWISKNQNQKPELKLAGATLFLHVHPDSGIKLQYSKWDRREGEKKTFHSKGNVRRLKEFVRSLHGTPLSLGLFVPFELGIRAVKEFMRTEGELPQDITWISDNELSSDVFPDS
jgi:hypothetical protein